MKADGAAGLSRELGPIDDGRKPRLLRTRAAVADTGPGIPADELPHIFDRYWKAQSKSQTGLGLGLYIASGMVEAHGGKIWAESSAAGARVSFTLPVAR